MGFYKLENKKDGLYIILTQGKNSLTDEKVFQLIQKELDLRKVNYNFDDIELWYKKKESDAYKITDNKEIDLTGKFDINISRDSLTAYLTIYRALNGEKLSLADIKTACLNKGITFGLDEVKIMIAIEENNCVVDFPIAKGRPAVHGRNAEIKFHFNEKGIDLKPKELENGKVDFYNIKLIQTVTKGQLLVEKTPATPGIPGMTVTGKELPAKKGKDLMLPLGKNVVPSADNLKGYASCEGHVVFVDRKVSVLPVYEVNGDVDFSTGNIDFVGNVIVKGNIKEGFTVKAKGDIEVFGTVEGGNISVLGNIIIKKGIRGLKKSVIEAKGNIYSNFIEYATVKADNDIIVNEAIMHSTVNAGTTIQVGGRRGLVVGGICRAGKSLICKNIGSSFATVTKIEVGISPDVRSKLIETNKNLEKIKDNIDKTDKGIKILKDIKNKVSRLPADKEILLSKLVSTKNQLEKEQADLTYLKFELEDQIKEIEEGFIKVTGVINCGVNVTIGRAYMHFTNEMNKVILKEKGVDISISPLENYQEEER